MEISPIVGFIWFLEEMSVIYGDPARRRRVAALRKDQALVEQEISTQLALAATAPVLPDQELQDELLRTNQFLYMASGHYMRQPHIAHVALMTTHFESILQQGMAFVREEMHVTDVSQDEFTDMMGTLWTAFIDLLAAFQGNKKIRHQRTYVPTMSGNLAPKTYQEAYHTLRQQIDIYRGKRGAKSMKRGRGVGGAFVIK